MAELRLRTLIEILLKGRGALEATEQLRKLQSQTKVTNAELAAAQTEAQRMNAAYDRLVKAGYKPATAATEDLKRKLDALKEAQKAGIPVQGGYAKAIKDVRSEMGGLSGGGGPIQMLRGGLVAVAGAFGVAVSAAAALREVIADVAMFAKYERALGAVNFQLRSLGLGSQLTGERIRAFVESIEAAGGPLRQQLIPVFSKFLGITKDVERAMDLTKLAADASETGFIGLEEAASGLANILQGRLVGVGRSFGVEVKNVNGELKNQAEILDAVRQKFGGYGDAAKDTQNTLQRMEGSVNELKMAVGELGAKLTFGGGLFRSFAFGVRTLGVAFDAATAQIKNMASTASTLLPAIFSKKVLTAPHEYAATIVKALGEAQEKTNQIFATMRFDLAAMWEETGEESAEALERGRKKTSDALAKKGLLEAEKAGRESEAKRLEAQLAAIEAGTSQRLAAELRLLDAQKAIELDKVEETNRTKEDIEEEFRLKRLAKIAEFNRQVAAANQQLLTQAMQAELAAAEAGSEERERLERELYERLRGIAVDEARRKGLDVAAVERAFDAQRDRDVREKAERRAAAEMQAEQTLLQAKLGIAQEGSQQRLDLEMEMFRMQEEAAIASAERIGANVEAIRQAFDIKRFQAILAMSQAQQQQEVEAARRRFETEAALQEALEELRGARGTADSQFEAERQLINIRMSLALQQIAAEEAAKIASEERKRSAALEMAEAAAEEQKQTYIDAANEAEQALYTIKAAGEMRRTQVAANAARANEEIARREAETKKQAYFTAANMAVSALTTIFGENKALAIASAIINTAEGISAALKLPFPLNFAVAALVGAAGAVQIAKIKSTTFGGGGSVESVDFGKTKTAKKGRGFDDPEHDRMAYMGGRRWADDWVRLTGKGWKDRLGEVTRVAGDTKTVSNVTTTTNNDARSYNNTYDERQEVHVHVGQFYGDPEGVRRLKRDLDRMAVREGARKVR